MTPKAHFDHVAYRVRDLSWYLDFFSRVMGLETTFEMPAQETIGRQVWIGGMQLIESPDWNPADFAAQRFTHIGYRTDDVGALLEEVYAEPGIAQFGDKHNWFCLPDGPVIEVVPNEG